MREMIAKASFDRHNPEPPEYLYRLRNIGHRRLFDVGYRPDAYCLSSALKNLLRKPEWMPQRAGVFLDIGCGHSPDAILARRVFGFRKAIKVDLWPPYFMKDCDYFREKLRDIEARKVQFIQGDACELGSIIDHDAVDLIGCNAMIDLLCPDDRALFYAEASKVLRPGGVMIVQVTHLAAGYGGWCTWADTRREKSAMQTAGFEQINSGYTVFVLRKRKDAPVTHSPLHRVPRDGQCYIGGENV